MKRQPSIATLTGGCGHASEYRRIHDSADHLRSGWLEQFPDLLEQRLHRAHHEMEAKEAWQFDADQWKAGMGLDELVFRWNNLPAGTRWISICPACR